VVRSCAVDDKKGWMQQVCGGVGACCRLSRTRIRTEAVVARACPPPPTGKLTRETRLVHSGTAEYTQRDTRQVHTSSSSATAAAAGAGATWVSRRFMDV
jgi:hypothetical protein